MNEPLRVRPITAADGPTLLTWRNDPLVRESSRTTHLVTADEHERWLQATLENADSHQFMAVRGRDEVGYVRFDQHGNKAQVSIYLNPNFRGQDLGLRVLLAAQATLMGDSTVTELRAYVKQENAASHRLFTAAGYSAGASDDHGTWYFWRANA